MHRGRTLRPEQDARIRKAIAERRRAAGYSQQQMADRLGVYGPQVSVWESKRAPTLPTLIEMAALFECSMSDLIPLPVRK